ncbi:MAG: hypothetical protein WCO56_28935 [Verrucomicrobiota bacterium]
MRSTQKHHNSHAAPASNPGAAFNLRSRRTSVGAEFFPGLFPFRVFGVISGSNSLAIGDQRLAIFSFVSFVILVFNFLYSPNLQYPIPVHPVHPVSSFAMFPFRVVCVFGGPNSLGYRRSTIGDFVWSPNLHFTIFNLQCLAF